MINKNVVVAPPQGRAIYTILDKGGTALGYKCCSFKSDFAVYQQLGGLRQDSRYYQLIDFDLTGGIL